MPARDTERFFTFLDHLPIAALVIVFDDSQVSSLSDQKIGFVNRKFLDLIGYRLWDQCETIIERVVSALQRGKNIGGDFIYSDEDNG